MDSRDYTAAWNLISSWSDDDARATQLAALREADRRPYVVIAMIRIGALLSKTAEVSDGFVEQLSQTPYAGIVSGILNITDQILIALDGNDSPENVGVEETMNEIPALFAKQEMSAI